MAYILISRRERISMPASPIIRIKAPIQPIIQSPLKIPATKIIKANLALKLAEYAILSGVFLVLEIAKIGIKLIISIE
jgi:hypothetical protein|tara:strand:- start:155 stop:388 length:234 start_codon:yes stop_codon:yes gene_type:complete